jgi:23S rRNA (cytidine1920-2'-O)/16S rRNA (cytidine1409-2'-O)-methyltransferase
MRADQLLVQRGLAASRSQAQRLIASGVRWRIGATAYQAIKKNGDELPTQAELVLDDASETRYVSRGGLKLEGALRDTSLDVRGWRCLDVGQSTGGFTDALLHAGAQSVVGVDVGHGQLHPSILQHPQVQCIQGLNARDLQPLDARLQAAGGFDLVVGDVSFISLTLVLPAIVAQLKPQGHLLMLVKPQFELQPGQLGKGGLVKDNALHEQVRLRIFQACQDLGLQHLHWLASAITGGDGNREFFVHAQNPANSKVST